MCDPSRSDRVAVLEASSLAREVASPVGALLGLEDVALGVGDVVLGADGETDLLPGCCAVLGVDGLTVGDCVGVVGGGPEGVEGAEDVEGEDVEGEDVEDPEDPEDPDDPDCA